MNLPNKLTMLRILLVPVFFGLMMAGPEARLWAFFVFMVASVTDFLDGYIARKRNLITDFGKIMDPLGDKILVLAAMVALCELGEIPGWTIVVVLFREFLVSGIRIVAAAEGTVIAAALSGKIKTMFQMLSLIFLLLNEWPFRLVTAVHVGRILFYLSILMTIVSGVEYVVKNKRVFLAKGI